jgi:hypothetical protein
LSEKVIFHCSSGTNGGRGFLLFERYIEGIKKFFGSLKDGSDSSHAEIDESSKSDVRKKHL